MNEKLKNLLKKFDGIEDFLFKSNGCICCGRECDQVNNYRLCSKCINKIPFTKDNFCLKCGEIIKGTYDYCITCKDRDYHFDYARSVFAYTKFTSRMILKFKYGGLKNYAKPLGRLLYDYYATSDIVADVLTFVPMPEKREKERGYNQAELLCEEFAGLSAMPMVDSLIRIKENPKQSTLDAKARENNINGSFKITDKYLVKNKNVLLIDDVVTTGATANECAKVLKKAGAKSVVVLSLAKTPAIDFKDI